MLACLSRQLTPRWDDQMHWTLGCLRPEGFVRLVRWPVLLLLAALGCRPTQPPDELRLRGSLWGAGSDCPVLDAVNGERYELRGLPELGLSHRDTVRVRVVGRLA